MLDFGKKFSAGSKVAFSLSRGTFWRIISVYRKKTYLFFITSGIWAEKTSELGKNFPAGLSKVYSTPPAESLGKNRLLKKNTFFNFTQIYEAVLSKLYSHCPEEHFEDLFIFENFIFFHHFWTLRAKLLAFCRKLFISVVKSDFLFVQRKNLRRKLFFVLEFASSSSHFQQKFLSASVKKNVGCVVKTVF